VNRNDFWTTFNRKELSSTALLGLIHAMEKADDEPFTAPRRTAYYRIARLRAELDVQMGRTDRRTCEECGKDLPLTSTRRRRFCAVETDCYRLRRSADRRVARDRS
jgi:hypothetical protein